MKYAFHGAFAPYIYGLIEKKRSLGYDYYESERILRTFDEFCREQFPCETPLDCENCHEMGRTDWNRTKPVSDE